MPVEENTEVIKTINDHSWFYNYTSFGESKLKYFMACIGWGKNKLTVVHMENNTIINK